MNMNGLPNAGVSVPSGAGWPGKNERRGRTNEVNTDFAQAAHHAKGDVIDSSGGGDGIRLQDHHILQYHSSCRKPGMPKYAHARRWNPHVWERTLHVLGLSLWWQNKYRFQVVV